MRHPDPSTTAWPCSRGVGETPARYTAVMTFNEDLVDLLLKEDDRDRARFFAGRDEAIRQFDDAIDAAGEKEQAVFRVFQGAPGCGKTSLARHLRETRGDEVLFVGVLLKHLASDDALAERVRHAAAEAGSAGARVAALALKTIGSRLRMQPAGDAVGDALVDKALEKNKIVLHMDEAQTVDETARQTLVGLHVGEGLARLRLRPTRHVLASVES